MSCFFGVNTQMYEWGVLMLMGSVSLASPHHQLDASLRAADETNTNA